MNKFTRFVGLDVGKFLIYLAVLNAEGKLLFEATFENTPEGLESLSTKLLELHQGAASEVLVSLEECGTYREKVTAHLHQLGYCIWLWNALLAKHAPLSLNSHKDDTRDARAMAQLGLLHQHKAVQYVPLSPETQQLRNRFRLRKQLIKARVQHQNQLDALRQKANRCELSEKVHQDFIASYNRQIKEIEKQIRSMVRTDKHWSKIYTILCSIPGIGPVTATQLIEVTDGFTRFKSVRQLAKYIGTMPLKYESGTSVKRKPRSSKKTFKQLKAHLTLGAVSVIREDQFFFQYYHRELAKGKHHLLIINNIRNMMLKIAFTLIKTGQNFDPKHYLEHKKSWKIA